MKRKRTMSFARDQAIVAAFDPVLLCLLGFALVIRLGVALAVPTLHHPDENFQFFEQAHRFAFQFGIIPWEWHASAGIRSTVVPFILGCLFKVSETVVGGPEGYLVVAKTI